MVRRADDLSFHNKHLMCYMCNTQ
ncbi:hypothetical protein AB4401_16145 [Vibrio cyclitrophicus]